MRTAIPYTLALSAFLLPGLATRGRADPAPQGRRTAIVEAVQKTTPCILTVKVEKQGSFNRNTETVGTAIIVDERGYAVTNRHVVAQAAKVTAFLADGTPINARVLVEEPRRDLAILKLEGQAFQALPLGPSRDVMVGETVIAVGNPYGYSHTVSRGIVSAKDREITMPGGDKLRGLIQTDAAINPGSSGGPLLNVNGELIGLNVAMREGAQGIAFAIPSDGIKEFLSQHLSARKLAGIDAGLSCDDEPVFEEGPDRQRVQVVTLDRAGPAAAAGIRLGDRLLAVAGRAVANRFDVERALWDGRPGGKVAVRLERDGRPVDVTLTLPEPPRPAAAAAPRAEAPVKVAVPTGYR